MAIGTTKSIAEEMEAWKNVNGKDTEQGEKRNAGGCWYALPRPPWVPGEACKVSPEVQSCPHRPGSVQAARRSPWKASSRRFHEQSHVCCPSHESFHVSAHYESSYSQISFHIAVLYFSVTSWAINYKSVCYATTTITPPAMTSMQWRACADELSGRGSRTFEKAASKHVLGFDHGVNFGGIRAAATKYWWRVGRVIKHRKNCECCPVSQLIVR